MSLVVATIHENEICLTADTLLTPRTDWAVDQPRDGLKIFFLDSRTALAYAGSVLAHTIISECARYRAAGATDEDILSFIHEGRKTLMDDSALQPDQIPDFLFATAGESPSLYRIVGESQPMIANFIGCIGNNDAVSALRGFLPSPLGSHLASVLPAMEKVIQASEHPTVGGYAVTARGQASGFTFLSEMKLTSPRYTPAFCGGWDAVDFGTAATGGFGHCSVVPKEPGKNGFGIYFYQGQRGFFYRCDLISDSYVRLTGIAPSANAFAAMITREIGYIVEACGELGIREI